MRIVVTLTTIPARVDKIGPTVRSLVDQSRKPDRVVLNVPELSGKTGKPYPEVPKELTDLGLEVLPCARDYGPITKLIPILFHEQDPDTVLVVVDDDMIYPKDFVRGLEEACQDHPDSAVGYTGWVVGRGFFSPDALRSMSYIELSKTGTFSSWSVSYLQGTTGMAFRRRFFPQNPEELAAYDRKGKRAPKGIRTHDDVWIGCLLSLAKIPRTVIRSGPDSKAKPNTKACFVQGLSNTGNLLGLGFAIKLRESIKYARDDLGAFMEPEERQGNPWTSITFATWIVLFLAAGAIIGVSGWAIARKDPKMLAGPKDKNNK